MVQTFPYSGEDRRMLAAGVMGENHRSGGFCMGRTQLPWEEATGLGCREALLAMMIEAKLLISPWRLDTWEMGFLPSLGDRSNTTRN